MPYDASPVTDQLYLDGAAQGYVHAAWLATHVISAATMRPFQRSCCGDGPLSAACNSSWCAAVNGGLRGRAERR
jgi:hypothetical protein